MKTLSELFGTTAETRPFGGEIICVYPDRETGRTASGDWGPEPEADFAHFGGTTWTQQRQYGAEDGMARELPEHRIGSAEEAQQIADKVTDKAGVPRAEVSHDPRYNYSFAQAHPEHPGRSRIVLSKSGMNRITLLHELAHHIDRHTGTQDPEEPHGDSFRGHFESLLPQHHPNSYVARHSFRHNFYWADQKMRDGVDVRHGQPNPEMNEAEQASAPVERPKPLWDVDHDHVTKANNALRWRSEPHGYLKYMKDYPELGYDSDEDYEKADAHMADEDLSKGLSPHLVPPHMLASWVKHHPNPKALEEPEYDEEGNDKPLRHTAALDPAARPHQAATAMAQREVREAHPEVGNPLPYSETKATERLRDVLRTHGHPGAESAFVVQHTEPGRAGSAVVYDADTGAVGVALHRERYDYGTLAHEAGHLLDIHRQGLEAGGKHSDDVVHGDGFRQGYHDALKHLFDENVANTFTRKYRKHLMLMKDDPSRYKVSKVATEDAGVYRGMSIVLPPHIHAMVHDQTQPAAARAHMLLSEIRKQKEGHQGEEATGSTGGLGSFWTPHRSKAEEYATQSGFEAYKEHEREHNCGDPDYGDGGCPTTRVVVHARTPAEKHQWKEIFRPGERYDPEISWRLPIRPGTPVRVKSVSWKEGRDHLPTEDKYSPEGMKAEKAPYEDYDFMREVHKQAVREDGSTGPVGPQDYAKRDGESGYDHDARVVHGLSVGHLNYQQAGELGYRGSGREDNTDSWTGEPNGKGWQPLPKQLWHTTTDAAGVMAHGLKSAQELGHNSGHGLGGTPQWLSLTDREDHAHNMLDALHEYHDHLNGKTSFADLHKAAQNGEGAEKPFHEGFMSAFGNEPPAAREARMQGKRIEPGIAFHEEAEAKGWEPHPEFHQNFGPAKDGRTMGSGWLRHSTVEERHEEYGAFSRAREWNGNGKPSILFVSNDRKAFAAKDPKNFAVLKIKPKPGAQGFPMEGEHEWRTGTGHAVEVDGEPIRRQAARRDSVGPAAHTVDLDAMDSASKPYTEDHEWLPQGRYWSANSAQNDQRLFEGDHLRPEVREDILNRLNGYLRPRYRDWPKWTRVYFAGSEAAKFQPFNGDFDILLGADFDVFRQKNPEYADQDDAAIAKMITDGMWHTINVDGYWFTLADGRKVGPFDRTFFMSPSAWDIRDLKPYAAYDVTHDRWAVHPLEVPKDWSAKSLPEAYWSYAEALLNEIRAIEKLPPEERHRMAANLFEELHAHRSDAFNGDGKGLFDLSNVVEKYLDQHPDKPWEKLKGWANGSPSGPEPWVPTTAVRRTLTQLFSAKAVDGADQDGIMVAFVPPKSVGRKLLVEDGEPLEALHVTLCYLGNSSEHTKAQMDGLESLVRAWARTQKPLKANIGGAGTFHNPEGHVLWAAVDVPNGGGVRHNLSELLVEHGYKVRNDHGWTPHITLKYHPHPVRFLPKVEPASWDVKEIVLCIGGKWTPISLGG